MSEATECFGFGRAHVTHRFDVRSRRKRAAFAGHDHRANAFVFRNFVHRGFEREEERLVQGVEGLGSVQGQDCDRAFALAANEVGHGESSFWVENSAADAAAHGSGNL